MKITSIKNNSPTYQRSFLPKRINFAAAKDILDINFTAKNKEYSPKLQEAIESDFMKDQIVNGVIKNKDGEYQEEVEELFLKAYQDTLDAYEEDGEEITADFKIQVQEATLETFKALKRKDGSFNLQQNIPNLISIALEAIENNIYGVSEIFDYCKFEDESISEELAEIICEQKMIYPDVPNEKMFYMFSQYFINNNTGYLDLYSIPMYFSLFSLVDAKNLSQTDELYTLVIDKNGNLDTERYEFAYNTIDCLQQIAQKEASKKSQKEDGLVISAMIISITGAIMESIALGNKGEFDKQKAEELLEYLLKNIDKIDTLYKKEGLLPINLKGNIVHEQGSIFNTKLFKLFNLVCC